MNIRQGWKEKKYRKLTQGPRDEPPLPEVAQPADLPQELEEPGVCVHVCVENQFIEGVEVEEREEENRW